jgi:NADPH-dependent glutamate synthase beta subunit-like oxidoreductase
VAIVGGATAGAEFAGMLAERGVACVVFEQNPRPYGKIEDGLPRWHVKLRQKEYETINERLSHPLVHFVPLTKIGRDLEFAELAKNWGFTSVILAHGAWRDRPLPIDGADAYVGKGLVYQNPLIYWFNHFEERAYDGPRYELADGAVVVGGGLASIDVMKVLQIERTRAALAARGVRVEMLELEHAGIGEVLARNGLDWAKLGIAPARLYYRRRVEDMPLIETPADADPARAQKFEGTRRKILEKAMQKYLFETHPLRSPASLIVEGERLVGLRFQHTKVEGGKVLPIDGAYEDVRAPLVVSSIGSIPEPMRGIAQRGELYDYVERDLGRLAGYGTVFSTGNVVTGKGNIVASRKHSLAVAAHVIESFLGLAANGHDGEEALLQPNAAGAKAAADELAAAVTARPPVEAAELDSILRQVRERQTAVGYAGTYRDWIARVTPPDLA